MALSYGFYNSLDEDRRYNSEQISRIFDGLITDGVYQNFMDGLMVRAARDGESEDPEETANDRIIIGPGRAWFNHTWTYNDSDYILEGLTTPLAGNRYVAIVLSVDKGTRANTFALVEGEMVNGTPEKPTLLKGEGGVYQYPLAYLYQDRNDDGGILQENIENTVGTEECPFVVSPATGGVTVDDLLAQWVGEYEEWVRQERLSFKAKQDELMAQLVSYESNLESQILSWFNNLTEMIDENVALNLQNQIGNLSDLKTTTKQNLVHAVNETRFVDSRYEEAFRPSLYCGLEVISKTSAILHVPKTIDLENLYEEGLHPGDILFCKVFKGTGFSGGACTIEDLRISDKDGIEWVEPTETGIAKAFYRSKRYVRVVEDGNYIPENYQNEEPPTLFVSGHGDFTILQVFEEGPGVYIFQDLINDSYSIKQSFMTNSGVLGDPLKALLSYGAIKGIDTNPLLSHADIKIHLGPAEGEEPPSYAYKMEEYFHLKPNTLYLGFEIIKDFAVNGARAGCGLVFLYVPTNRDGYEVTGTGMTIYRNPSTSYPISYSWPAASPGPSEHPNTWIMTKVRINETNAKNHYHDITFYEVVSLFNK